MKKIWFLLFCLLINLSYANFLNSLFHGSNHHKHSKSSISNDVDYTEDEETFKQFCQLESTTYGQRITCIATTPLTNFKPDASATVQCQQVVNGIGSTYPTPIKLDIAYVKSLAKCKSYVYGPNILQTAEVKPSNNIYTSVHQTSTDYDIVCDGQGGYESQDYVLLQKHYTDTNNYKIEQCLIQHSGTPQKFVMIFELCIALAVLALLIALYRRHKEVIDASITKLKNRYKK